LRGVQEALRVTRTCRVVHRNGIDEAQNAVARAPVPKGVDAVSPVARNRTRMPGGRPECLNTRLTDEDGRDISTAAARIGLTRLGVPGR